MASMLRRVGGGMLRSMVLVPPTLSGTRQLRLGVALGAGVLGLTASAASHAEAAAAQTPPDCTVPACRTSTKSFFQSMRSAGDGVSAPPTPCPPGREELGRHSWTLVRGAQAFFCAS